MKLIHLVDAIRSATIRNCRKYSTIEIPKRAKRDELSILMALNSTTRPDYLAPEYRFIDDPFLIPVSGIDKREYSVSYVSGKDAARYLIKRFPKNFEYKANCHPLIKDFMPNTGPTLPLDTVDGLKERISMKLPIESYNSYRKLADEGKVKIPRETMDDLLDLICFTNHEASTREVHIIERYVQDEFIKHAERFGGSGEENVAFLENVASSKLWKVNGAVENLVQDIMDLSLRNISSLIKGMVKFSAHEQAYQEYSKGVKENLDFDVTVYNSIISCIDCLSLSPAECWESVLEVLRTMNSKQVAPTTKTYNEVLKGICSRMNATVAPQKDMKEVLGEMKKCGLEPNLTTWHYVLKISYPVMQIRNDALPFIINELSKTKITIQEDTDFEFFVTAMSLCLKNLRSVEVARELSNLVVENGYEHLIGNSRHATSFYSNYIVLLGKYDTMENLISEYNRLTPNIFSPTFKVFETLLNAIDDFDTFEHIPKIWSDMVMLRFTKRPDLIQKLLMIMAKGEVNEELQAHFVYIVDYIVNQYVNGKRFIGGGNTELNGQMVSDMLSVYLKSEELDKCEFLLDRWKETENSVGTIPSEDVLYKLCQAYIRKNNFLRMLDVFKLASSYSYLSCEELYGEAVSKMDLSDDQKRTLRNLI